jgi:sulfate permease, SulP family
LNLSARPTRGDFFAGVSVAAVLVPQSLAYAELAGMPAHHGLYAATIPLVVAGFFASSPYLQTGPVALTSLLVFASLSPHWATGTSEYVAAAALLAILVGLIRVAIGLLRGGKIVRALTPPVVRGFMSGAAVLIAASQLPAVLGVEFGGSGLIPAAANALASPGQWEPTAIGLGFVTLGLIFGGRRVHAVFPGVLIAVVFGIACSQWLGYTGATIGPLPTGFPPLQLDLPWATMPGLVLPAFVIALVGFAEPASIARTYADEDGTHWDPDAEFVSQGAASLAAGALSGFPVGGSFSRSAINRLSGAATPWSGAITGVVVLAVLPFGTLLEPLPRAVLGGVIIGAALSLLKPGPILEMLRSGRRPASIAVCTCLVTIASAPRIEFGVLVGIGLAGAGAAYNRWSE